jgi:hypothetical protein
VWGVNVNRGYLCGGCTGRVGTIRGSSVAYLVVEGSESREYWT